MNSKKILVLIGMSGSGKSTIGSLISKKLKLKFVDTDREIEKKEKLTISNIFSQKGENYFRILEEKITLDLLNSNLKIVSIGGGGFINKKIQKKLLNDCFTVWLNWKKTTILNRLKNTKKRPIINNLNDKQILNLIVIRSKEYEKADNKINCENLSKNEIVNKIIKIYEN